MIALRDLAIGEVIVSEKPLLKPFSNRRDLEIRIRNLEDSDKRKIMVLFDKNAQKSFLGILDTNDMMGEGCSILYNVLSRFVLLEYFK